MGEASQDPTVSVIIPTYNRADAIGRAIDSVLAQAYGDLEILVVDDASSDGTRDVVQGYEDGRVGYVPCRERGGAAKARNRGIGLARGEYVSFLDSDDLWEENKLHCDMEIMQADPGCLACTSGIVYVNDKDGRVIARAPAQDLEVTREKVLRMECSTALDLTVRKKVILDLGGFDESLPARQDWDLWIRIASMGHGRQERRDTYINRVKRGDQISSGRERKIQGTSKLLDKHRDLFEADRIACRKVLNVIALMYILEDDPRAVDYLERSYALTSESSKKAKILLSKYLIKTFGHYGIGLLGQYFRKTHADDYLLW